MSKIEKTFTLSDSTVNSYGYRLLTSGYQIDEFKKNPIGYYMHGTNEFPRESGVLLKWEDLRIVGDRVMGKPVINLNHPRGERTLQEVESGFLNAASVGHLVALEVSYEPSLKLPGQTGPTVTKWYNREASLVDVPGNYNAFAELYDRDGNKLNLADFGVSSINSHVDSSHQNALSKKQVTDILSENIKKNNITPQTAVEIKEQYIGKPKGELEEKMSYFSSQRLMYLVSLGFSELDKKGLLEELLERSYFEYSEMYFDEFGKEVTENNMFVKSKKRDLTSEDVWQYAKNRGLVTGNVPSYWPKGTSLSKDDQNYVMAQLSGFRDSYRGKQNSLLKKNWDELDRKGQLEQLKHENFQVFQEKFKEKFGVDYKSQASLYE